jgi:hypothetical protein
VVEPKLAPILESLADTTIWAADVPSNERGTSTDPPAGTVTVVPKLLSIEEALRELGPGLAGDPNGEAPLTLQPARLAATSTTPTVLTMTLRLH